MTWGSIKPYYENANGSNYGPKDAIRWSYTQSGKVTVTLG